MPVFAVPFFLFSAGLTGALFGAELAPQLELGRAIYTMGVSLFLALPALFLFSFGLDSALAANSWRLFWSFSLLAYLIHVAYALAYMGKVFYLTGQSLPHAFISRYGWFVAIFNSILTVWWICDVALAWFSASAARWIFMQRLLLNLAVAVAALVATFPKDQRRLQFMAIAMAATFVVGALLRLALRQSAAPHTNSLNTTP
jgi:hypothetical protein